MTLKRFCFGTALGFAMLSLLPGNMKLREVQAHERGEAAPVTADAHGWFIRLDGGDRKQCTGKADQPYKGKGNLQPCAFKHPYYLFTNDEYGDRRWVVGGGDTVLIHGGPYRMGYRGPNPNDRWGSCPGNPYECSMPSIPSGTPGHPTRFLGEQYGSCQQKTQLFGGYGLGAVVNLQGSKNVDVECLELTDHGQCTRSAGEGSQAAQCNTSYPLSDYASAGIATDADTAGVVLKNLDIHGFISRGIIGPIGGEILVDHVRIAFNGLAGWDFDNGSGTKSGPESLVKASYLTVEWNGCNEEYPIHHSIPAFSCFDQNNGGYGDGVGTPDTQLNFSCDHCTFRYNTQDGLDLLHTSGSVITVTNSQAYGNMGQQWKMGPMRNVRFLNNTTVHNCNRMSAPMAGAPENYNRYLSLYCRAQGDGIAFVITDGATYVFQNNSFAGYGSTSYDITCGGTCTKASIIFQNNLHVGYKSPIDGKLPAIFYGENIPRGVWTLRDHNVYFNMRGTCPLGFTEHCSDPKIAKLPGWSGETSLDSIDFHLTGGSLARGAGVAVQGLSTDHDGAARPVGSALDIGAFQFRP